MLSTAFLSFFFQRYQSLIERSNSAMSSGELEMILTYLKGKIPTFPSFNLPSHVPASFFFCTKILSPFYKDTNKFLLVKKSWARRLWMCLLQTILKILALYSMNVVIVRVITLSVLIYSSLLSNNKKNCFVFGSFIDSKRRNEVATQWGKKQEDNKKLIASKGLWTWTALMGVNATMGFYPNHKF